MGSRDLFFVHVPSTVVNDGGYIVSAKLAKEIHGELEGEMNFQKLLDTILIRDLQVREPKWSKFLDSDELEVKFAVPGDRTEHVLNHLLSLGIGDEYGSIWLSSLEACRPRLVSPLQENTTMDKQFMDSVKARMIVDKVVEMARASSAFSFDYVSLVICASLIALFGLAYNNVVVIVASMLVSPIMGPIVALTFGAIVRDMKLVKTGLINEAVSLLLCIAIGYVFGLMMMPYGHQLTLPNPEMLSRGEPKGLILGLLVAIPSGVGVALSILGNNTSSLVGVAISASLLPPAVNTGLLLAVATVNDFEPAGDALMQALYSLLITLINIVVIIIMAFGMFKLKEVAPFPGKTRFWKEDVKLSREYHQVLKGNEAQQVAERIRQFVPQLQNDPEIQEANEYPPQSTWEHYVSYGAQRHHVNRQSSLMALFEEPSVEETPVGRDHANGFGKPASTTSTSQTARFRESSAERQV